MPCKKEGLTELTYCFVVKYLGKASIRVLAPELPDIKERLPVNVGHQLLQVIVFKDLGPDKCGLHYRKEEEWSKQRPGWDQPFLGGPGLRAPHCSAASRPWPPSLSRRTCL